MASFEKEFSAALDNAERNVFIDLIRSRPDMSLADLAKLSKGRFSSLAGSISIGELLTGAGPGAPRGGRGGARKASAPVAAGKVNTRTPEGRDAYDKAIMDAVAEIGEPASAPQIRALAGGTELQARKSLNRLIEAGRVTFTGKARGTRYMPTK